MKAGFSILIAHVFLLSTACALADCDGELPFAALLHRQNHKEKCGTGIFARNVTANGTLAEAERIVLLAQDEARKRNDYLIHNVRKNKYEFREQAPARLLPGDENATGVNATIAKAAALVAEFRMMNESSVGLVETRQASGYWMAEMVQNGRSPLVLDVAYKVSFLSRS
jgi:hypothetical protein